MSVKGYNIEKEVGDTSTALALVNMLEWAFIVLQEKRGRIRLTIEIRDAEEV